MSSDNNVPAMIEVFYFNRKFLFEFGEWQTVPDERSFFLLGIILSQYFSQHLEKIHISMQ